MKKDPEAYEVVTGYYKPSKRHLMLLNDTWLSSKSHDESNLEPDVSVKAAGLRIKIAKCTDPRWYKLRRCKRRKLDNLMQ